jgi:hypothetical protein
MVFLRLGLIGRERYARELQAAKVEERRRVREQVRVAGLAKARGPIQPFSIWKKAALVVVRASLLLTRQDSNSKR